jgi:hypothetical protein
MCLHLIRIQDYQESFPIQDNGMKHAEASESVKIDIISDIESELRHHTKLLQIAFNNTKRN